MVAPLAKLAVHLAELAIVPEPEVDGLKVTVLPLLVLVVVGQEPVPAVELAAPPPFDPVPVALCALWLLSEVLDAPVEVAWEVEVSVLDKPVFEEPVFDAPAFAVLALAAVDDPPALPPGKQLLLDMLPLPVVEDPVVEDPVVDVPVVDVPVVDVPVVDPSLLPAATAYAVLEFWQIKTKAKT